MILIELEKLIYAYIIYFFRGASYLVWIGWMRGQYLQLLIHLLV